MFNLIVAIIHKTGVLGVFVLMLIENIVPVIPSELIMPMAGYEAARGALAAPWVVAAGTVGSILGGAAWYWVGRRIGLDGLERLAQRGGRWLPILPHEIRRGGVWFQRWGALAVCVGRSLPGVRGVICIPAGMAGMPFGPFLVWSSLGALFWTALLTWAGFGLETHYAEVGRWLNPVADGFLLLSLLIYGVRVARFQRGAP